MNFKYTMFLIPMLITTVISGMHTEKKSNTKNYILLFTFQGTELTPEQLASDEAIKKMNESPYDGFAVPIRNNNKGEKYEAPDYENDKLINAATKILKQKCKKDLWPTCFLNCIVKYDPENCHNSAKNIKTTMAEIPGIDLDNETGRLEKFLKAWKDTLLWAKELKSPGVIFDHEYYNNYPVKHMDKLAAARNEKPEILIKKIEDIGRKMADIAEETYPGSTILVLDTKLFENYENFRPTHCYFLLGLLKQAKERNYKLKLIDGGETSIGYLHSSVEELQYKIWSRFRRMLPLLKEYTNLKLAGCIAPFVDKKSRPWWMTDKKNPQFPCEKAEDFVPFIVTLLNNFEFVWIYGGSRAYVMFNMPQWPDKYREQFADHAKRMNKVIEKARKKAVPDPLTQKNYMQKIPPPTSKKLINSSEAKAFFVFTENSIKNAVSTGGNTNFKISPLKFNDYPFPLCIEIPPRNEKEKTPSLTVSTENKNLSDSKGIVFEVYNPSDKTSEFMVKVSGSKAFSFIKKEKLTPNGSSLVIIPSALLLRNGIDLKQIKSITFTFEPSIRKQEFYFSNIMHCPIDPAKDKNAKPNTQNKVIWHYEFEHLSIDKNNYKMTLNSTTGTNDLKEGFHVYSDGKSRMETLKDSYSPEAKNSLKITNLGKGRNNTAYLEKELQPGMIPENYSVEFYLKADAATSTKQRGVIMARFLLDSKRHVQSAWRLMLKKTKDDSFNIGLDIRNGSRRHEKFSKKLIEKDKWCRITLNCYGNEIYVLKIDGIESVRISTGSPATTDCKSEVWYIGADAAFEGRENSKLSFSIDDLKLSQAEKEEEGEK